MSLAKHVEPRLPEARVERQWDALAARLDARPRPTRLGWVAAAVAVAAVGAAAFVLLRAEPAPSPLEGAVVTTGADGIDLRLRDGRISIGPGSRLGFVEARAERVRIDLARGSATFDVRHRAGRRFVVTAGPAQVDVVGTRFRVTREGDRVTVSVARGAVEIRRAGARTHLGAGETWSIGKAPPVVEPPRRPLPNPLPESRPALPETTLRGTAALPRTEPPAPGMPPSETAAPTIATATARELFDLANVARRDRRLADAASAYDAVLARFPSDPRVGLAAYELGRLRMDSLGDLPGAIEALERATTSASVREGAMARLVEAYERTGRTADCARARDAYLARYPAGVQAATIRDRCEAR